MQFEMAEYRQIWDEKLIWVKHVTVDCHRRLLVHKYNIDCSRANKILNSLDDLGQPHCYNARMEHIGLPPPVVAVAVGNSRSGVYRAVDSSAYLAPAHLYRFAGSYICIYIYMYNIYI